jgi:undecaprenyl-diphosphatase
MSFVRSFDRSIISTVQLLPDWVQPIMVSASFIGSPVAAALIFVAVMGVTYAQKNMRLLLAESIVLAALPLASILKILTHRTRPETMYVEKMLFKTYSFPSGHAYVSLLVFGFLAYLSVHYIATPWNWVVAGLLVAFIALVGISRIYLGAHFPSDVLGGWILGGFVLFLIIKFVAKL